MRFALTALALVASAPAFAGGFGLLTTGGFHTEIVRYYDTSSVEMRQASMSQTLSNRGGGFELILGDKDDAFTGVMRGYYLRDAAQKDPAELTSLIAPEDVQAVYRDEPRPLGVGTVGLQWGFLGDPTRFQAIAIGSVGSGFLTQDHTEFLLAELGAGATYEVARNLRLTATLQYSLRYRKGASHGANGFLGVRYYID